jgi:hypothetical protein
VVEVAKELAIRMGPRNQDEVRGLSYSYHVHVPGRGNLLRYDNSHGFGEYHRHEYDFETQQEEPLELLTREEFPTLIEVLDEVQAMARRLGLAR